MTGEVIDLDERRGFASDPQAVLRHALALARRERAAATAVVLVFEDSVFHALSDWRPQDGPLLVGELETMKLRIALNLIEQADAETVE
jgi:hypothetical protein